ncbi:MAG: hypothetical protein MUE60_03650 [Candidatus Eisenbacteria bacterium]|nr:hypothetical protein [Candidatus Eisenbacteria bacterium]
MTVAVVTLAGMAVMLSTRAFFLAPEGWSALAPDEAQRAWHALQVMQGRLIYRDLWVQYTPISFYWHALAFSLFGPSLAAIRLALVATGTVTLGLVAWVANYLGGRLAAVLAGGLFLTFGIPCYNSGYPAWESMAFSMAALAVVIRTRAARTAWIAGLLAGLSTMTKINVGALTLMAVMTVLAMRCSRPIRATVGGGAFVAVGWLVRDMPLAERLFQLLLPLAVLLAAALRPANGQGSPRALAAAGLGCATACIVVLAPFAVTLGPGEVFHSVVREPLRFSALIRYSSPVLRLGPAAYAAAACWAAALVLPGIGGPKGRIAATAAAILGAIPLALDGFGVLPGVTMAVRFLLAPVLVVATAIRPASTPAALAAATWAGFLHVQLYPGQSGMHLAWALVPAWPLLVGVTRAAAERGGRFVWVLPVVLFATQLAHGAAVLVHTDWVRLDQRRGGISVPRQDAVELTAVIDQVRGETPSSVLDLTSGCLVAFLAESPCPLRHAYFWRGFLTPAAEEAEVRELSKAPPPVAVRRSRGRDQFRWDAIAGYAPTLARWLDGAYRVTRSVGRYEILAFIEDGAPTAGESRSARTGR